MNPPFQFLRRLATGGEILAQQVTFLPAKPARPGPRGQGLLPEIAFSGLFCPIFGMNRKNLTVAQPLLMEVLR